MCRQMLDRLCHILHANYSGGLRDLAVNCIKFIASDKSSSCTSYASGSDTMQRVKGFDDHGVVHSMKRALVGTQ